MGATAAYFDLAAFRGMEWTAQCTYTTMLPSLKNQQV